MLHGCVRSSEGQQVHMYAKILKACCHSCLEYFVVDVQHFGWMAGSVINTVQRAFARHDT